MKEAKEGEAPKKPLTPYFMFMVEEKEKGNKFNAKEGGRIWREMPEDKKQPYIDRHKKGMEVYEKYMIEVEGYSPKRPGKEPGFSKMRIKAVCTSGKNMKPAENLKLYKGLSKVMVTMVYKQD